MLLFNACLHSQSKIMMASIFYLRHTLHQINSKHFIIPNAMPIHTQYRPEHVDKGKRDTALCVHRIATHNARYQRNPRSNPTTLTGHIPSTPHPHHHREAKCQTVSSKLFLFHKLFAADYSFVPDPQPGDGFLRSTRVPKPKKTHQRGQTLNVCVQLNCTISVRINSTNFFIFYFSAHE